uniref:IraD/Gp25-like domain-containing protein n=1 Tax=Dulem virus 34 TaxID=3145752 RepID=A0AAU8B6D0_9CAUD
MTGTILYDFKLEYTFTGDYLAELDRQLALLLSTREGTMPLDRSFGLNMDFVDMPPEAAKSLYAAEVTEKVAKFIPAVRVQEITWNRTESGKLNPKVVITSA